MTAAKFVEKYDLYRPEDHRAAEHAIDTINREGIEVVRVVWPDQHGLLRGKALTVPAFLAAMKAGNEITMAPFFFDTANAIVFNPFSPDGGFDFDGLGGSPNVKMVPDPGTFTVLPWAEKTALVFCDLYMSDGKPFPLAPRTILKNTLAEMASNGAVPTTELATLMGVRCRPGIVVDDHARTSDRYVVAAGDCTLQPHPHRPGELLAVESVNNAVEQGRTAAHTLLDREPPARGVPWFWSNQGALKIQIAGISDGHDRFVVRRGAEDRLTVLYYRDDVLIAGDTVNDPREHMAIKRALAQGAAIDPDVASDTSKPLRSLVTPLTPTS